MDNVTELTVYKLTKEVHEQLGEDFVSKDVLESDIKEAMHRNAVRLQVMQNKAEDLKNKGKNPYPCHNSKCPENIIETNSCSHGILCDDCLLQMTTAPPNSLHYTMNDGFPSHKEALDLLVENDLLKDDSWKEQMETIYLRDQKKPATYYERDNQKIDGVTMRHFRNAILTF